MENTIDITPVVKVLVQLVAVVVTLYVLPAVKHLLQAKLTAEQRETVRALARIAVDAAEQIYLGPARGEEKKEYAAAQLEKALLKRGLRLDTDEINAEIEAAVKALNDLQAKHIDDGLPAGAEVSD